MFNFFDTHSHIHEKEYDSDREEVLSRMRELKVGTITVGTHLESSKKAVELAQENENVWATIGLHPTDTKDDFNHSQYKDLALNKKVVAVGECGLDYFRLKDNREEEKNRQRENFLKQLEFAVSINKPLMIHCRPSGKTMDAHEEMVSILSDKKREHNEALRGAIHFFTGTKEIAKKYFDLGFLVSFPGVITFTDEYDEVVKNSDISMILSETDSPYASPTPYRGKRNEPVYVVETVRKIALIKGISLEKAGSILSKNVSKLFSLAP